MFQQLNLQQIFSLPQSKPVGWSPSQCPFPIHQVFKPTQNYNNAMNSSIPSYLGNLKYPPCDIEEHEEEPLSMLCIDKRCQNQGLICAICEGTRHIGHQCVPVKVYLNQVYGLADEDGSTKAGSIPQIISQQDLSPNKKQQKKIKLKNKYKSQTSQQLKPLIVSPTSPSISTANSKTPTPINILQLTQQIQSTKTSILSTVRSCREQLINSLHEYETYIIKYFNKISAQISAVVPLENPVGRVSSIMDGILWLGVRIRQQQDHLMGIDLANHSGMADGQQNAKFKQIVAKINQYKKQKKSQTKTLKLLLKSIISNTKLQQKFNLREKTQSMLLITSQLDYSFKKQFLPSFQRYIQVIKNQMKDLQGFVLKQKDENSAQMVAKRVSYRFSQKNKGHKFVLRNQNKIAQQTGMESSGQRFILMQPSLPKPKSFFNSKSLQWSIKVVKLAGWVALGISMKNSIVKANYNFHYTNIGHGSYLISGNGYSWSHSVKQFNSAYKSFLFTTGDTIHIKYLPNQKKIKFIKNQNQSKFQMDVVEPSTDDQFVPSVNMCSNGDTVEILSESNIQFV